MPWYRKLHWQIIIGLVLGLLLGLWAAAQGWGSWVDRWIAPLGTVFINLLKLIAVPLVLASLIVGVTSLSDLRRLSRIGTKTIALYIATTVVAITLGLVLVNLLQPGHTVPADMRERLQSAYAADVEARAELAQQTRERGPLQLLVDIVPENVFSAAADNRNMLQVVFIALLSGIGLLLIPQEKARPVIAFFDGVNALVIRLVELIMRTAPVGVFALMAGTITSIAHDNLEQVLELLTALGYYSLTVLLGLVLHTLGTYPLLVKFGAGMPLRVFFGGIAPAQLVAFSTSSSGATLPVTMECAEKNLKIPEEVSSFVLPLGATINMDGTALYQAVASVFIAQTLGLGLDLGAQLTILLMAVLASIGTAAVPSAGIVMLVIILESVGVPSAGIALILGVDRILDMCRTVTNVTGDLTVASVVAATEHKPAALPSQTP
ncbi:dicarboxylate/amino acid:cation symporter [Rhodothermus bifroesti]|uniref:dicarboxylate/amino acid:cation symporter n=1 Tax=Rhodothermus bifroesti TaxID=2823335 RepID=UPI001AEF415B|nr:dicarboxylate/amino acid:cation symporter [Rhodothermus bifroesti]